MNNERKREMHLFIQVYISDNISEMYTQRPQMYMCDIVRAPWEKDAVERDLFSGCLQSSRRGRAWPQTVTQKVRSTAPCEVQILGEDFRGGNIQYGCNRG